MGVVAGDLNGELPGEPFEATRIGEAFCCDDGREGGAKGNEVDGLVCSIMLVELLFRREVKVANLGRRSSWWGNDISADGVSSCKQFSSACDHRELRIKSHVSVVLPRAYLAPLVLEQDLLMKDRAGCRWNREC